MRQRVMLVGPDWGASIALFVHPHRFYPCRIIRLLQASFAIDVSLPTSTGPFRQFLCMHGLRMRECLPACMCPNSLAVPTVCSYAYNINHPQQR